LGMSSHSLGPLQGLVNLDWQWQRAEALVLLG
jgi:hypothetical protein